MFNWNSLNKDIQNKQGCNSCVMSLSHIGIRDFKLGTTWNNISGRIKGIRLENNFNDNHVVYSFTEKAEILGAKKNITYYLDVRHDELAYYSFEIDIDMNKSYFFNFLDKAKQGVDSCNSFINPKRYISIQKDSICTKFLKIKNIFNKKYISGGIGYN